jgi:hypothetical protein
MFPQNLAGAWVLRTTQSIDAAQSFAPQDPSAVIGRKSKILLTSLFEIGILIG